MEQGTAFIEALTRKFSESEVQWKNDLAGYEKRIDDRLQHHIQELELAREQVSSELDEAKEAIDVLEGQVNALSGDLSKAHRLIE